MRTESIVIAMLDRAEGNESVGTAWTETAVFSPETPVKEIIAWAQRTACAHDGTIRGKLTVSYPHDERQEA